VAMENAVSHQYYDMGRVT